MHEMGLMSRWNEQFSKRSPCLKKQKVEPQRRVLRLKDFKFPFLLLGTGLGFAFVMLLAEKLSFVRNIRRQYQQ